MQRVIGFQSKHIEYYRESTATVPHVVAGAAMVNKEQASAKSGVAGWDAERGEVQIPW